MATELTAVRAAMLHAHDVLHNARSMLPESDAGHAEIGEAMRGLREAAALAAPPEEQQAAKAERITIDFKQATELLAMFGGEPAEVTLITGDGHSGTGLYAYYSELPEEGAEFLGQPDDEATPPAAPQPAQPAPQAGAAEVAYPSDVELDAIIHSHKWRELHGVRTIARTVLVKYAHPTEQPSQAADAVLVAMADGYKVEKTVPWDAMTDEANRESAWMVSRSAPPFCDKKSMRIWTGPTAIEAVRRAQDAMGPAIAARADQAQGEKGDK